MKIEDLEKCKRFARVVASRVKTIPDNLPWLCQIACFENGCAPRFSAGQREQIVEAFYEEQALIASAVAAVAEVSPFHEQVRS